MLAHGRERDVAHDDHLLVLVLLELSAQVGGGVLLHAAKELLRGARHALRRAPQALAVRVLADRKQELAHGGLRPRLVYGREALVVQRAAVAVLLARRLRRPKRARLWHHLSNRPFRGLHHVLCEAGRRDRRARA